MAAIRDKKRRLSQISRLFAFSMLKLHQTTSGNLWGRPGGKYYMEIVFSSNERGEVGMISLI